MLGGTQSLHTNCYDEALALPTEDAVRIALRTQQIIAHETGVANTIDPLGGSYFVEALTDEIEAQAYDYFAGSTSSAAWSRRSSTNFPQREIADASYELQQEIDAGRRIVVGVNAYTEGDDERDADPEDRPGARAQADRPRAGRPRAPRRRRGRARRSRDRCKQAAATGANLMPPLLDCARAHATEGEIVDALQQVFGRYTETPVF